MPAAPDGASGQGADAAAGAACDGRTAPEQGQALRVVLALEADDDAGAETASRYEWQAAMAAAEALSMLAEHLRGGGGGKDEDEPHLVCELHEDWIACAAGEAELVSAKHREAAHGTVTTLPALVDDLGVGHLFSRWLAADRLPSARVVTTAALTGACRDVVDLCGALSAEAS